KGSVVIYQPADGYIIILADHVELQNFTLRRGTATIADQDWIRDNNVACTVKMTDLVLECVGVTVLGYQMFLFTGPGNYTIERCSYKIVGTGVHHGIHNGTNSATLHLIDNDFEFIDGDATGSHVYSSVNGTWTGKGNRWAGTCQMLNVTAGDFTFDNDAIICTAGWTNTGSTMMLRNCAIEAPVVAGDLATVRMKNCSYRAIQRTGTGNIVDEGPDLKDAPWHIERWTWQAALANAQVAVRGVPLDAGSGQIIIETL
ncbi:unnamed protein product, partial [marine sediment metagenome]